MKLERAEHLALCLMEDHGLSNWQFAFDDAVRRFGSCCHSKKTITLSAALVELNGEDKVKQTILHEIAHALVGVEHDHNETWRQKAISIGHHGGRCYEKDVVTPKKPFIGTCPSCDRQIPAFRRRKIACGKCCRAFNKGAYTSKFRIKWSRAKAI